MFLILCVLIFVLSDCLLTIYFCFLFVAYLASLEQPEITELAINEYRTATNMTDQFAALAAIAQNPGKARDEALYDFYNKWQDDFLVRFWCILRSIGKTVLGGEIC